MTEKKVIHFKDSVFFDIEKISRYSDLLAKEYFEKVNLGVTHEEFRALDVLICNPDCCQRDLAKLMLRDRTRAGRIVDSLEQKGLIERYNDTKGKRLVKKMKITEEGFKTYERGTESLQPKIEEMSKRFTEEQITALKSH